jgi:hypothetical protein
LKDLLNYFVDLCLLRAVPQDAPYSLPLLYLASSLNVMVGMLLVGEVDLNPPGALLQSALEAALMLATLYLLLLLRKKAARFVQSGLALMGSGVLLGLVALPLSVQVQAQGESAVFAALMFLVLLAWSLVVMGHVIRHTFEISLPAGVLAGFVYSMLVYSLISGLHPVTVGGGA